MVVRSVDFGPPDPELGGKPEIGERGFWGAFRVVWAGMARCVLGGAGAGALADPKRRLHAQLRLGCWQRRPWTVDRRNVEHPASCGFAIAPRTSTCFTSSRARRRVTSPRPPRRPRWLPRPRSVSSTRHSDRIARCVTWCAQLAATHPAAGQAAPGRGIAIIDTHLSAAKTAWSADVDAINAGPAG